MQLKVLWLIIVVLTLSCMDVKVKAGKVLFVAPIGSKSQNNFMDGVLQELVKSGHQVTMITPFRAKKKDSNVREIILEDMDISPWIPNAFEVGDSQSMIALMNISPQKCSEALGKKAVQDILKEQFDIVFMKASFCDCFLHALQKMQVPLVQVNSLGMLGVLYKRMGVPYFTSITPDMLIEGGPLPFGFTTRLLHILMDMFATVFQNYYYLPWMEEECVKHGLCEPNSIRDEKYNLSLVIANSVRVLERPFRPSIPTIIHAGGIHCKPPKPLPKDIEDWISKSKTHGFIYFSLGSIVKFSDVPKEKRDILLKVLGSLPQQVLWKMDQENVENLPSNVMIKKWLPQQDIIGDRRIRLFISHGGLLSTIESTYHGVPVLGMPVFLDQDYNMRKMEETGAGSKVTWSELEEGVLREKINYLINNKEVQDKVAQRAQLMKDYPISPSAEISFWVDHIVKNKGSGHLRSPVLDMYWYEVYDIDVYCSLIIAIITLLIIIIKIISTSIKCIYRLFNKKKLKSH